MKDNDGCMFQYHRRCTNVCTYVCILALKYVTHSAYQNSLTRLQSICLFKRRRIIIRRCILTRSVQIVGGLLFQSWHRRTLLVSGRGPDIRPQGLPHWRCIEEKQGTGDLLEQDKKIEGLISSFIVIFVCHSSFYKVLGSLRLRKGVSANICGFEYVHCMHVQTHQLRLHWQASTGIQCGDKVSQRTILFAMIPRALARYLVSSLCIAERQAFPHASPLSVEVFNHQQVSRAESAWAARSKVACLPTPVIYPTLEIIWFGDSKT